MALAPIVPVFLDKNAGYNEKQVNFINTLVRTSRRSFESKAIQKMKDKPKISHLAEAKYNRVLNFKDYLYNNYFTLSFILNPAGFVQDGVYNLFETNKTIVTLTGDGCHTDDQVRKTLSSLGNFQIVNEGNKKIIQFKVTSSDWPTDADNNLIQFSVCIVGRTTDDE